MHEKNSVIVEFSKEPDKVSDRKLVDKLTIYFQKQQVSGGCDVCNIQLDRNDSKLTALVVFEDCEAVKTVLLKKNRVFNIDAQNIPLHVEPFSNDEEQISVNMATDEYSFDSLSDLQLHSLNSIDDPNLYPEVHSDEDLYSSSMITPSLASSQDLDQELHKTRTPSSGQNPTTSYTSSPDHPSQGARSKTKPDDPDPMEWQSNDETFTGNSPDVASSKRPKSDCRHLQRNAQAYGANPSKQNVRFGGNSFDSESSEHVRRGRHSKLHREHDASGDLDKECREYYQDGRKQTRRYSSGNDVPEAKRHGYNSREDEEPSRHSRETYGFATNTSPTRHQVPHDQHGRQQNRQSQSVPNVSEPSGGDGGEDDSPSQTVAVTNLKPSTTQEILELHFESKRHGGGPISDLTLDNGSATITFEDPKVAASVANRPHKIEKEDVTVQLVKKKKPRPKRPIDRHRLLLTNIPDGVPEETLLLYIEGRTKIDEDPDILYGEITGTAMIGYSVEIPDLETVVDKFKKRKLKNQIISASCVEYPDCILVQNLSPSITDDALELYFESERKSGGGVVREVKMDEKRPRASVYFEDWGVVDRVVRKQHYLSKTSLHVSPYYDKLGAISTPDNDLSVTASAASRHHQIEKADVTVVKKKTPRSKRPIDRHQLLLTDIPDGVTEETLVLFVEGRTKIDEDPDILYGEIPGTAMIGYSEEIPDLETVLDKFKKRKLKNQIISASCVEHPDCILVQNLSPSITDDALELYFESERKSGGGVVREVKMDEKRPRASVFFEDWKVVNRVVSKQHSLSKTSLHVSPYYDKLGVIVTSDRPTPRIPDPITVKVDPAIAEFVLDANCELRTLVDSDILDERGRLHWPSNGQNNLVEIIPVSHENDSTCWLDWSSRVTYRLNDIMNKFKSDNLVVDADLWSDVCNRLQQLNLGNVRPLLKSDRTTIVLRGPCQEVNNAMTRLTDAVRDLEQEAERARQTVRKEIKLGEEKFKYLYQCNIKEELDNKWQVDVKILTSDKPHEVIFEGMRTAVADAVLEMYTQLDNILKHDFEFSPNKVGFVKHVEDKVHEILTSRKIYTSITLVGNKVTLTACAEQDIRQAYHFIQNDITEATVAIQNQATVKVLQTEKGRKCLDDINETKAVLAGLNRNRNCIELTGFKQSVQQAVNKINDFIETNAVLQEHIQLIRGKVKYLMEYSNSELQSIREHNKQYTVDMKLVPGGAKSGITVSGTERGLKVAVDNVKSLSKKIVERQYPVTKPGMPELLKGDKGKKLLGNISRELSCFIDSNSDSYAADGVAEVGTDVEELRRHTVDNGVQLVVCNGDLTVEKVDAIVNAANIELKHLGGLAGAILKRGGDSIKNESREIIRKNGGPLQVAQAEFTGPGKLPCQHIIHVAGPKWERGPPNRDEGPTEEEDLLFDSVRNVLRAASRKNLTSISIPALSAGVYGFPIDLCAQTVVEAAVDFCKRKTSLKEIRFTNIDKRACDAFLKVFEEQFGDERDNSGKLDFAGFTDTDDFTSIGGGAPMNFSSSGPSAASQPTLTSLVTLVSRDTISTKEQKTISLKRGDIAAENVNVIVNTTGSSMNLASGGVSNAILAAGGPSLQQNCQQVMAQQGITSVNQGDFIETGPANLNCQRVFHCVGSGYNGPNSEALLRSLMQKILQQANQSGSQSIAIPAIGTGTLAYPHDVVAEIMYDEAITFSKQNAAGSLTDIRFVVYHRDQPTIKAFEDEMQKLVQGKPGGSMQQPAAPTGPARRLKSSSSKENKMPVKTTVSGDEMAFGTVQHSVDGSMSIRIGHITVQLQEGDLTQENTDAIVNSAGHDLSLNGPMSKAIVKAGGNQIARECEQLVKKGDKNVNKGAVRTTAGRLPCQCIIHVVTPHTGAHLKSAVLKALRLAETDGMRSIAFPALGTGKVGGNAATAASVLLDAIGEFAANTSQKTLRIVKLTIFQKQMVPDFAAALKGKENVSYKPQKGLFRKGIDFVNKLLSGADDSEIIEGADNTRENKSEQLILRIFAGNVATIEKAVERIDDFILDEFCTEELRYEQEMWGELDQSKMNEILSIGANNNVEITSMLGGRAKRIIIQGRALNVQKAKVDIQEMFTKIHMAKKKQAEDQLFNREVQWRFKDSTGVFTDYGDEINPIIERAYQKKDLHVDLDLEDGTVRIDFFAMEERQRGSNVKTAVHRADLKKEQQTSFSFPTSWIPMTSKNSITVLLTQGTREFTQVQTTFQNSLGRVPVIHKIERIQIVDLYKSYMAKMDRIKTTLPGGRNAERVLFHGTSHDSCDKINKHGFNRSYCGKNGVAHGNGTYFAKDASYSDGYAQPSGPKNQKHMYMSKVLTGEYTQGKAGMVSPPPKANNPNEMYDSVVNNLGNPGVFVIFHDSQAYPEYLIHYN